MLYKGIIHIGFLGMPDVILNFYFVSLGHGPQTIGILQSLPRLGGLLTGIPVGLMASRIGTRRLMLLSSLGVAGTFLAMVLFQSITMLMLARFVFGFFFGAIQVASAPMLMSLAERPYRTHLFSYFNIVSLICTSFGSFIGGYLPSLMVVILPGVMTATSSGAYGGVLFICALVVTVSIVPLVFMRETETPNVRTDLSPSNPIPWKQLLYVSIPMLTFGFSGGLTFPFFNLFFRTVFDVPDNTIGTILSVGWIGMALFPLLNPLWDKYIGKARSLGVLMTVASLAFLILGSASTLALGIMAYVMAISIRNTMQPLYQPLVMENLPAELHNVVSSVGLVIWNIGWFAATAISGFWQVRYGFGFIMSVVAINVFISGMSIILIFGKQQSSEAGNS